MSGLDLVLAGGVVADGGGGTPERLDVGLRGDRVATLGLGLQGRETIDVSGHVVAPGFIDAHGHSDLALFADPVLAAKTAQGVTCEVLGQDGLGPAPLREEDVARVRRQLAGLDGEPPGLDWSWRTVRDFLDRVRAARAAFDACFLAPHAQLRRAVGGDERRALGATERDGLRGVLRDALAEGAVGCSTGLIYPPASAADAVELRAIGEVLAESGRPLVVHLRSEGDRLLESVEEILGVARATGCPVHLSHVKVLGRANWLKLDAMLDLVEAARDEGLRVTADQYPYTAASTFLGAILPPWVHDGGPDAAVERLGDPAARARIAADLRRPGPQAWESFWSFSGPDGIVVADIASGNHPELLGKSLSEAAGGADPLGFALDLLRDERLGVTMVSHSQDAEVVARLWARPWVCGGSDGLLGGRPHPRTYGAFPRMLAWLVRERRLCTLGDAVRKMAALPAEVFGLDDLGAVAPGKRANLVVFDPERVADRSTFAEPRQTPAGIALVLCGGRPILREGTPTGERPGVVHVPR